MKSIKKQRKEHTHKDITQIEPGHKTEGRKQKKQE